MSLLTEVETELKKTDDTPKTMTWEQEPKYPSCLDCEHYAVHNEGQGYCLNQETEKYISGGLDKIILDPENWYCPLFTLKAEG